MPAPAPKPSMSAPPPPPPGGKPGAPGGPSVEDLLSDAKASGKLAPLEEVIAEEGYPVTAEALLEMAQQDDRTHGKSPEELADMLRADSSLFDDLEATQPGGVLHKAAAEDEAPGEDDADTEKMMDESASMKDADKTKGKKAMKKIGGKPGDMGMDAKMKFMRAVGEE